MHSDIRKNFFLAAYTGDIERIQQIIDEYPEAVTWRDQNNDERTALMSASEAGHSSIVTALIVAGAEVNATNSRGSTSLMFAGQKNAQEVIDRLLENQADPNVANKDKLTALMISAWENRHSICRRLVEAGAKIDACDAEKNTALMLAATNGKEDACFALLDLGADKKLKNAHGQTAAELAKGNGYEALATALSEHKPAARKKSAGNDNKQPDIVACASRNDFETVLKFLENDNEKVNAANSRGSTLLMFACMKKNARAVQSLLRLGADPHAKNGDQTTALMVAASEGDEEISRILLEAGANIQDRNSEKLSAADFARKNNFSSLAEIIENYTPAIAASETAQEAEKGLPEMLDDFKRRKEEALKNINALPSAPQQPSKKVETLIERLRKGGLTD